MSESQKQPQSQAPDAGVVTVLYSSLTASPFNVRRREPTNIKEMADSIGQSGLLQNLVVHVIRKGRSVRHGVCAGMRRHRALDMLRASGQIPDNYPVPVRIVSDAEARAFSLIENAKRENMHPADQFEAFRDLIAEGRTIEHIAALFSVSPVTVQRRLKLAAASPKLFELFREDDMTLDQLMALSLSDDHQQQERIWFSTNPNFRSPSSLRQALTKDEIDAASHPLARFIGIDAYEAAGGQVRRDLFSDSGNGYLADAELLHTVAHVKLEETAAALRAQGWAWVAVATRIDQELVCACTILSPATREQTADEQEERTRLEVTRQAACDALDAAYESDDESIDGDALELAYQQAEEAINAYDKRFETWTDQQKAVAGVHVAVSHAGELDVRYGLVKRENKKAAAQALGEHAPPELRGSAQEADKPLHGEKLCARLTAHRTAIIRLELSRRPEIALVALLARMVPDVVPGHLGRATRQMLCVQSDDSSTKLTRAADDMADSPAWKAYDERAAYWRKRIAKEVDGNLFGWLLQQDGDTLRDLFAFCVAATVDSISHSDFPHAVNRLADALNVDYRTGWKATGPSYFNHVTKARVVDVVKEAAGVEIAAPLEKMKKAEAVAAAERVVSESGWLPEVLRNREYPDAPNDQDDEDGEAAADNDTENEETDEEVN
ncbi:ParB/RepB/Spo0J family partition protein (plasmid) [Paraburkholderia acidicola]|uniref:ParB/RepB/Spo0J family partition protein n=1 Tax=Paraburkholderia acidicola TaxID=1912599 RepID=A0ABV1LYK2_9BURK